jgi:hypothetical protein
MLVVEGTEFTLSFLLVELDNSYFELWDQCNYLVWQFGRGESG